MPFRRPDPAAGESPAARLAFLLLFLLATAVPAAPQDQDGPEPGGAGERPPAEPEPAPDPGVTLLDGTVVAGKLQRVAPEGFVIGSQSEPIPHYEVQEIRFGEAVEGNRAGGAAPLDHRAHPLVRFQSGEQLAARVLEIRPDPEGRLFATLELARSPLAPFRVPLEALRGFRLREAHPRDDAIEHALEAPPPGEDTFFVRRSGLLRVTGVFRELTADQLIVERDGRRAGVRRQLIQGMVFAPVASRFRESDPASVFEMPGSGRLPGYLAGLERDGAEAMLLVRFPGAPPDVHERLPARAVSRILMASDRVLFLSAADPVRVEEASCAGPSLFPYRRDLSVSGDPLRLAGRRYRRGLGVHSRSMLEYRLSGQYRSFAAVIGLDDSAGGKGSVTFRVVADGKEIYTKDVGGKTPPEGISLPMESVESLQLIVGYGADGLDFSDHADWADARVTK